MSANSPIRLLLSPSLLAAAFCVLLSAGAACAQSNSQAGFTLQDFLGRTWRNEVVRFPLSPAQSAEAAAGIPLVGPDQKAVPYQVERAGGAALTIQFTADLNRFEKRTYAFAAGANVAPAQSDIRVEQMDDVIRVSNSRVGIAIRKTLSAAAGPIAGIRLASGTWIGGSSLAGAPAAHSYTVQVTQSGPVVAEVVCEVNFGDGRSWQLRLRLQAAEPVILVDETFSLGVASWFQLSLGSSFAPTHLFYRFGKAFSLENNIGKMATWPIPENSSSPLFTLEPWLHWDRHERQGTWVGLYDEHAPDLLAFGTRSPSAWIDPDRPLQQFGAHAYLTGGRGQLKLTLPLADGARSWMISALDKDESLAALKGTNLYRAPLPQQYQIKHGDYPLDRIKDYVLQWPGDEADRPRLITSNWPVARICENFRIEPAKLKQFHRQPVSSTPTMDEMFMYYLCSGDDRLREHMVDGAISLVQEAVDRFVKQDAMVSLGFAPHQQTIVSTAVNLAGLVWPERSLSPRARERLKAQLAFLAYVLNRDDFWSPARGFAANPNMTTTVFAYRAMLGAAIPAHPQAAAWVKKAIGDLTDQVEHWSDPEGGWLEAPHYAMVSYDALLGVFLMAHNAGLDDSLFSDRMRRIAEWFAKISTPPDPEAAGRRHLPPIGNTYMNEPTGEFGLLAGIWKNADPDFAATMQWMDRQQGSLNEPGIGGFYPTLAGFRKMLRDDSILPKQPDYGSELFSRTGVMLRAHFRTDRETQLYLIAGTNHAHYDQDSGSFTLWGKGRLIANDFGYHGYMPADDHNMVAAPSAPGPAIMQVANFSTAANLDYVRGIKSDDWTRQIAFVKDTDPLGPNYFVLRDFLKSGGPFDWRLWLSADEVVPAGAQRMRVIGKQDVDTDVYFLHPQVRAVVEHKTRTTVGVSHGKQARIDVTQKGIVIRGEDPFGVATLLYPRLKSEPAPRVTDLADGKVIKVDSAESTDYVFLNPTPFSYRTKDISFSGTVGLVQVRGNQVRLSLGAPGILAAFGRSIRK